MEQIVYKLLKDGHSFSAQGIYRLPYRLGQRTYPVKGTKWLLAWKEDSLEKLLGTLHELEDDRFSIVKAWAKPVERPAYFSYGAFEEHIAEYWSRWPYVPPPVNRQRNPYWQFCAWIEPFETVSIALPTPAL